MLTAAAVLLAAVAAALAVRSPPGQFARVVGTVDERRGHGVRRFIRGRPDAPALPRRIIVAAAAGSALTVLSRSWGVEPFQLVVAAATVLAGSTVVVLGRLEPAVARRRRERLIADLPQALELLAAALEAGAPLRSATAAVVSVFDGPVAEDLGLVLTAVDLGVFEGQAWRELTVHPAWARTAVDVARSAESGSMMVETLRQHAHQARAARRAAIGVAAKSVGVRSVLPLMLCFMPAFMLIGVVPTVASAILAVLG